MQVQFELFTLRHAVGKINNYFFTVLCNSCNICLCSKSSSSICNTQMQVCTSLCKECMNKEKRSSMKEDFPNLESTCDRSLMKSYMPEFLLSYS